MMMIEDEDTNLERKELCIVFVWHLNLLGLLFVIEGNVGGTQRTNEWHA